jgi:hypothetical protein
MSMSSPTPTSEAGSMSRGMFEVDSDGSLWSSSMSTSSSSLQSRSSFYENKLTEDLERRDSRRWFASRRRRDVDIEQTEEDGEAVTEETAVRLTSIRQISMEDDDCNDKDSTETELTLPSSVNGYEERKLSLHRRNCHRSMRFLSDEE